MKNKIIAFFDENGNIVSKIGEKKVIEYNILSSSFIESINMIRMFYGIYFKTAKEIIDALLILLRNVYENDRIMKARESLVDLSKAAKQYCELEELKENERLIYINNKDVYIKDKLKYNYWNKEKDKRIEKKNMHIRSRC